MRKEHITLFDVTENGLQASKVKSKENVPMNDKRLEIVFNGITKIVVIIMSFLLIGTIIVTADTFKLGILAGVSLIAFFIYFLFRNLE